MKAITISTLMGILLLCASTSMAASVGLAWTPTTAYTDGTAVAGMTYNVYNVTGTRAKVNTTIIPASACTGIPSTCAWTFSTTPLAGQKFVVTAVDPSGGSESADSNIAVYHGKLQAPGSLVIVEQP